MVAIRKVRVKGGSYKRPFSEGKGQSRCPVCTRGGRFGSSKATKVTNSKEHKKNAKQVQGKFMP